MMADLSNIVYEIFLLDTQQLIKLILENYQYSSISLAILIYKQDTNIYTRKTYGFQYLLYQKYYKHVYHWIYVNVSFANEDLKWRQKSVVDSWRGGDWGKHFYTYSMQLLFYMTE